MARNGSGTYNLPQSAFVYDTVIDETKVNSNFSDIADALTASISKDGQTTPTANLPMGGFKLTGLADGSAKTDSAALGQIQGGAGIWCGTAGGTANAITLSPTPAITAYAAGQRFEFKAGASANSGAVTFAISGLSTISGQVNGASCTGGEVAANQWYRVTITDTSTAQIERVGKDTSSAVGDMIGANNLAVGAGGVANAATARTNLGLGTAAILASDTDTTLAANSDSNVATQKATKVYISTIPSQSKSANYTTVLTDAGFSIDHPSTDANARTFTIDSNANVAYPVGTCISFSNMTSNVVTIAITSDTMYLAGTGTTGSRSLAQYGMATARKLTSTTWMISGVGLT